MLCGGAGSCLVSVSREGRPKPFMQLADGQSLLLKTCIRATEVVSSNDLEGELISVANRDCSFYFISMMSS